MASDSLLPMDLDRLEALKRKFGSKEQAALPRLLRQLGRARFPDAESLIRFHEALLFFRAYPPNAEMLRLSDELLQAVPKKIEQLRRAGVDLTPFEEPDVSGIAGTAFSALFTYEITRWLAEHHPKAVEIDWDGYDSALLGPLLGRLHPFANEDLLVEANIPYMDWFRAAKRGRARICAGCCQKSTARSCSSGPKYSSAGGWANRAPLGRTGDCPAVASFSITTPR